MNSVLFELQRAKFPPNSRQFRLRLAGAVSIIEADLRDAVGKLQALICQWVKSTTQPNQWITLVEAIVMCDEPAVARDLATAVGVDYPPHSGTAALLRLHHALLSDQPLVYCALVLRCLYIM